MSAKSIRERLRKLAKSQKEGNTPPGAYSNSRANIKNSVDANTRPVGHIGEN